MTKERGIVFCPEFEDLNGDIYIPHVQLRKKQIQFFCLYWDYVIQPVSAALPMWKRTKDEIILEDAGILFKDIQELPDDCKQFFVEEHAYSLRSDHDINWADNFVNYQETSLKRALREKPDVLWTPQQSYRKFLANPESSTDTHCVQMELHNKLPVPAHNASIKKIVRFKSDNSHLFSELKSSIDKLTHYVSQAGEANQYSIELATNDLEKITAEIKGKSRHRFGNLIRFEGIKLNIGSNNLSSVLGNAAKGAICFAAISESLPTTILGAALGGCSSLITLEPKISKRLNCLPESQLEMSYLTQAYNSKILDS
ncbi:hypothetical protein [Photobacterium sp. 1_MG-2023]|uniref:hypothetical protein n=1 Tax=Photobacterium sp. 1_MG-2023 TaxID=3062646 RepID=UPI0026E48C80|nr:hypothetical protein [Photobacterium sp. 1_MG-2023]MDO6708736.1 hypothetical protein [Photobacterium sp. 1_MG-2023]